MKMRPAQQGLGLVELMIGVVIGLITILVIGQISASYEGAKRTSTGGSDAQSNGAAALMNLAAELRMAGYGLINAGQGNGLGTLLCPLGTNVYYNGTVVSNPGTNPPDLGILAPVRIFDGGAGSPDSIVVVRSDAEDGVLVSNVRTAVTLPNIVVDTNLGFTTPGQMIMIAAANGSKICTVFQLSAAATATGSNWNLTVAAGGTTPYNPANPAATYASFPNNYGANDKIVNLGYVPTTGNLGANRGFVYRRYEVQCRQLVQVDPSQVAGPYNCNNTTPLVDEIVDMQAQYGIAPANSQTVNQWVNAAGAWAGGTLSAAQISQIKAIRIAVVARSPQLEKTPVTTAPIPLWTQLNAGDDPPPTFNPIGIDQQYRYKVSTTIVPVKNVIWGHL